MPPPAPDFSDLKRFLERGQAAQRAVDAVTRREQWPGPVDLHVLATLTVAQAYALAELCKRIGWADARSMAVDDNEATAMINACERVRSALDQVGVRVR